MEETVSDGCSVIMREDSCTAHSECICQNGNRDCRTDQDDRTPEPIALQPAKTFAGTWVIAVRRVRKVSKHDRKREQRHQRPDTAASLDNLQLLCIKRIEWFQLDNVS